jgi:uncharacterized membrane protein YcfT
MGWKTTLMDLRGAGTTSRLAWADMAKAISILLLVFWTVAGDAVHLNELLIFVRMPLFFFVSGLFAYRAIVAADLGAFLRDKIGNLVYLYALWIGVLFLTTELVAHLWWGAAIDPLRQLRIFWDPIFSIWFLYALAIAFLLARALRRVPVWIVLAGAVALYLLSVASGEWRHLAFLDRLARLFPFFWLGLVLRPLVAELVERHYAYWPAATAVFLALAYATYASPADHLGALTFTITLVGIAALLGLARQLAAFAWTWPLGVVGASTLAIYVTHKVTLFYLDRGLDFLDLDASGLAFAPAKVAAAVVAAVLFDRWVQGRPRAGWLLAAPWTLGPQARRGLVRA